MTDEGGQAPPVPEVWRCEGCGEEFDTYTFSHAVHARDCDGNCRNCPVECGPVSRVGGDDE